MHNMSKEFYKFIAEKINAFLYDQAFKTQLVQGDSFYLKLDDDMMVSSVADELKQIAINGNYLEKFEYTCSDGKLYETFALKLKNADDSYTDVVIGAQYKNIQSDFLCATLRNYCNKEQKALLLLTVTPIDSAKSGAINLSSNGMPFYYKNLLQEIRSKTEKNGLFANKTLIKEIVYYEINNKENDSFSDKNSLYEYRVLLSIINSGKINREYFPVFRLFYVDPQFDYISETAPRIKKMLNENNETFEELDWVINYGDIERDLSNKYKDSFIKKLKKEFENNHELWSINITYKDVLSALQKKQQEKDNPLEILSDNITVYGDEVELNHYSITKDFYVKSNGSQKSKKRKNSILIFNSNNFKKISLKFYINLKLDLIEYNASDGVWTTEKSPASISITFSQNAITYHKINIKDKTNDIEYEYKICIVDLKSNYLMPQFESNFQVEYGKNGCENPAKCKIKIFGISPEVIEFNISATKTDTETLIENNTYTCAYDKCLKIVSTEQDIAELDDKINFNVDFSNVVIHFLFQPDLPKSVEITSRNIFREKFRNKKNFTFINQKEIHKDSEEYFVKGDLLHELQIEQFILDNEIEYGICNDIFEECVITEISKQELQLTSLLKSSYKQLLNAYKNESTVPTLAFANDDLKKCIVDYLSAINDTYASLQDNNPLSKEQEDALLLGVLAFKNVVVLTPLHPLNLLYQLSLQEESRIYDAPDNVIDRLNSNYLLPYILLKGNLYKVADNQGSKEWKFYTPNEDKQSMGQRYFVADLVKEKITEYVKHFRYIFSDINNYVIKINLINLGNCKEVFKGLAQLYKKLLQTQPDLDKILKMEIRIYREIDIPNEINYFSYLSNYDLLKKFLVNEKLEIDNGISMIDVSGIMVKNISCFYKTDNGKDYDYSHISFYEMESHYTSLTAAFDQIDTGISLNGIVSNISSVKYSNRYRTGFGTKYAASSDLIDLATLYNSLFEVSDKGNPYQKGVGISTQIEAKAQSKMDYIYDKSNWVVFVEPKVDLDFFCEQEANNKIAIIHYSDQYTNSSSYDAITVTQKTSQYSKTISEFLKAKGVYAKTEDVNKLINIFNAVNGDWLLRLITAKKAVGVNAGSMFTKEKISIAASIKFMLSYLKHENILWIPLSLEEILRVSKGVGLSQKDGLLSAKNLGFEDGATSDDLLFVGLYRKKDGIKLFLYPTEVKAGINDSSVITKARSQVLKTADGLKAAFFNETGNSNPITVKVHRNFLMQLLITSCKKMKIYHIDDQEKWDIVIDRYRKYLLNENYNFDYEFVNALGKGAVLSFKTNLMTPCQSTINSDTQINMIELPETDEFGFILDNVDQIYKKIRPSEKRDYLLEKGIIVERIAEPVYGQQVPENNITPNEKIAAETIDTDINNFVSNSEPTITTVISTVTEKTVTQLTTTQNNDKEQKKNAISNNNGIKIIFGTSKKDGSSVIWEPNNTDKVLHTNTGIIGTMGTGKTQFTQSIVAQLYQNRKQNIESDKIGILIFDYKGDYNEDKADFIALTNATVLHPYHLPFNPLALNPGSNSKPLLPLHSANTFVDTLSKVYTNLGTKQKNLLLDYIMSAYATKGINKVNKNTWNNQPPTLETVYNIYDNDETINKNDSLAAALKKIHEFEIFEPNASNTKSLFDLLDRVIVIDMHGYDSDLQNLIVAITLDIFYSQMQVNGHSTLRGNLRQLTKFVLVDEADNFLRGGYDSLRKILKEGREFGVGTILSTQFLKHFMTKDEDYSKYILTWIVHKVDDLTTSDIRFVFNTENGSLTESTLLNKIKKLNKHESVVKVGNISNPIDMKDKPFWEYAKENLNKK